MSIGAQEGENNFTQVIMTSAQQLYLLGSCQGAGTTVNHEGTCDSLSLEALIFTYIAHTQYGLERLPTSQWWLQM